MVKSNLKFKRQKLSSRFRKWIFAIIVVIFLNFCPPTMAQFTTTYWRDTLCQNNLRLNYTPNPFSATVQTPPVYDFIGKTLVQVYSGIATTKNDTNLSFNSLINGFGNLSLLTFSPISIKKSKSKKIIYYSDFFTIATGTIPNQTGVVEEVLGTAGLGLNNSLYLNGDLNKLHFIVKHKIGASYGKYPGLLKIPSQRIVFYQCIQFRIKSVNGALVIDFPLKLTPTNISPFISVGYYQKI